MAKRNYQTIATVYYPIYSSIRGDEANVTKRHAASFGSVETAIEVAKIDFDMYSKRDGVTLIKVEVIDKTSKQVLWTQTA